MDRSDRSIFNLMTYPKFQGPFLATIFLSGFIVFLMMGAFCYLQMRLLFSVVDDPNKLAMIKDVLWYYGWVCGFGLLFGISLVGLYGLLLSHRIAGPIPRLKKQLKHIIQTKSLELIRVRNYDYLRPLFKRINKIFLALARKSQNFDPPNPP